MTALTVSVAGHVGLNVSDLERSLAFYEDVFRLDVQGRSDEEGRRFAFLSGGGRLVLTLWQQSRGAFDTESPGLHHLSFEVEDLEQVRDVEERVRARGATIHHDGIVAHGEGASSGGIFFLDPDGIRLEVYAPVGAEAAPVPSSAAPTCGFF